MNLADILDAHSVLPNLKAQSKKQLLQELSQSAAGRAGIGQRIIFETLLTREKLGSTGLGQGIAIPHGKFPALARVYGFFARLAQPIPFDAVDDQPVDLVFLLLAPEHAGADHLKALARISRLMRDSAVVAKLRGTTDAAALYAILTEPAATATAA
jgi:nitrogen PTS system EIIA component